MRKVFIDGGANEGSSIDLFLSSFEDANEFEIFSFECNPKLIIKLEKNYSSKITLMPYAITTTSSYINFFIGSNISSTLRMDKKTGNINYKDPVVVKGIDFSNYIKTNFNKEDYLIVKLDIEGEEYDVIPHLVDTGAIEYIDELYGEWHFGKLKNISKEQHEEVLNKLESSGMKMKNWDALTKTIEK